MKNKAKKKILESVHNSIRKTKNLHVIAIMNMGGAGRQLIELVKRINKDKYDPVICCLTRESR